MNPQSQCLSLIFWTPCYMRVEVTQIGEAASARRPKQGRLRPNRPGGCPCKSICQHLWQGKRPAPSWELLRSSQRDVEVSQTSERTQTCSHLHLGRATARSALGLGNPQLASYRRLASNSTRPLMHAVKRTEKISCMLKRSHSRERKPLALQPGPCTKQAAKQAHRLQNLPRQGRPSIRCAVVKPPSQSTPSQLACGT